MRETPFKTKLQSPPRWYWIALLVNMIWMNASEIWRYFAFVMPMMRTHLAEVPSVAPMNLKIFAAWGVWDTILIVSATSFFWMFFRQVGTGFLAVAGAATSFWVTVFVIFWFALINMNLASLEIALTALPLAWLELIVAAAIVRFCFVRNARAKSTGDKL